MNNAIEQKILAGIFYVFIALFANQICCGEKITTTPFSEEYKFPKAEYEHYMKLVQEIDPSAYEKLRQCEKKLRGQCIEKNVVDVEYNTIEYGSDETHGYPILIIRSMLDKSEEYQKDILRTWLRDYEIIPPLTPEERQRIMNALKSIAPGAYDAITKIDSTGSEHVKREYGRGASIAPSKTDGLPDIKIDVDGSQMNSPLSELKFTVAHELSHYVLGHFGKEAYQLSHQALSAPQEESTQEFKKGKKVSGQLQFKETFEKAYSREQENEADRFAILQFGINIDEAIATMKRWILEVKEHEIKDPHKETFQRTHPYLQSRIEYLDKEVRREVEIQRAPPKPIDWEALAEQYKKILNE